MRRNAVYAGAAFVILELVSIVQEPLNLPEWTLLMIIVLLSIGFVVSIVLSWIYEFNPEGGLEKTNPAHKVKYEGKRVVSFTWKIASYFSFIVIVALILFNVISARDTSGEVLDIEKSIVVLPLQNMSDNTEFSYLGDALTEEIIMQLYKIRNFDVQSLTTSMYYKNTDKTSDIIGKELDVNYILGGSAQRYEDHVRIRVWLIHASSDDQIWGDIYKGEWKDIFYIQEDMAKKVAEELKTVLSLEEVERIERNPTDNLEAYSMFLKARYSWHTYDKNALDISLDYYLRAVELDPDFAPAYAGLAITYETYAGFGYSPPKVAIPKAREAAMKALELDSSLVEAHAALAWIKLNDWDLTESELGFKRAIELNPNYAFAHYGYSWYLTYIGQLDDAIEQNKRALELDPLDINSRVSLGRRYYYKRDYDMAIEEYRNILESFPDSWITNIMLALVLSQKGLHDEAIEKFSRIEINPSNHWYLGFIYGQAGKRSKASEILDQYLELSKNEYVPPMNIAFIYIGLGEIDEAFKWLQKSYEQIDGWYHLLQVEPMYDDLRSDPRFQDLVDRMNFSDY